MFTTSKGIKIRASYPELRGVSKVPLAMKHPVPCTHSSHLEKKVWVPDDDEEGLGPRDGHVEPLRVPQESQLVPEVVRQELLLRAHRRHDDHLTLLSAVGCAMEPFASNVANG